MLSASLTPPVLQLHPTRVCNLRCLHCYSSSAPGERGEQDASLLVRAIGDAAPQGYRVVSVSGGEPLLYSRLADLLLEARQQGLQTTVTTNGLLLDERRLHLLADHVDFLAISLDGAPERHNYLRNAPRAFETMHNRLSGLRSSGIPFGFLFTLTHDNVDDLGWAADFAAREGASVLQVHPLEETGRAQSGLAGKAPTDVDAAVTWLLTTRLSEKFAGRLKIHLDLVHRDVLVNYLFQLRAERLPASAQLPGARLADFISPLVIEADGMVVPLQYGFPRAYVLGNLNQASIAEIAQVWLGQSQSRLENLYSRTADLLRQPAELPFVNWFETVANVARQTELLSL
jgi:MoaA/NifB/PqqE/SkfB family radical SAM enzyme